MRVGFVAVVVTVIFLSTAKAKNDGRKRPTEAEIGKTQTSTERTKALDLLVISKETKEPILSYL